MKQIILGLFIAGVAAAATVPLAASADRDQRLVIGVRLNFVSSSHADGTFAACCAVNDGGAAHADITAFTAKGDTGRFEAIETFNGSNGSFRLGLRGTTGPLSSPRHIARGTWQVLDGTGGYAGLSADGRFTAVTDEDAGGALTAVNSGEADE